MEVIEQFSAGDPVPNWLVKVDPDSVDHCQDKGDITFSHGCSVWLWDGETYLVVPDVLGDYTFRIEGPMGITIRAATKQVAVVSGVTLMDTDGTIAYLRSPQ